LLIVPVIVFQIFRIGTLMILALDTALPTSDNQVSNKADNANERLNLLLLGEDEAAGLTDVIMIVSLDKQKDEAFVLQIPRDTYAEYTSSAYRKLNGAKNVLGSGRGLADFFEENLGIKIDHFVLFDLEAVAQTVDALGGVEIDIPIDMSYSDPYQNLKIELKKGVQVLNGEKAKQFVRFREGYVRGDLDRLDTQKLFLSALLKKALSSDMQVLMNVLLKTFSYIESDLFYEDCLCMIRDLKNLSTQSVFFITLPGADIRGSSGAWYYIMNRDTAYGIISEKFSNGITYNEFDKNRKFTSTVRSGFNDIYEAKNEKEPAFYSADEINNVKITQ